MTRLNQSLTCLALLALIGLTDRTIGGEQTPRPQLLEPGDRLVILGDSISAMCRYTVLMDLYLAACRPDLNITFYQDAISGEDTERFLRRFDGMLSRAQPDLAISFYGVNDAGWRNYSPEHLARYEANTREVLKRLKQADVRAMLATTSAMGPNLDIYEQVNEALLEVQATARQIAADTSTPLTDVHTYVLLAQEQMREQVRLDYDIIGRDGAHADWQAHMAIATAFLRGLGLGEEPLAVIELDTASGKATASEGHEVLASDTHSITLRSSRFPFYFLWDNPGENYRDMPKVAEIVGFFDDLNRYMLVVKNLPAGNYEVTWDRAKQTFSAEQLAEGINLAHAFHRTPFDAMLYQLWQMSLTKCNVNATIVIDAVHNRKNLAERSVQIKRLFQEQNPDLDLDVVIDTQPEKVLELFDQRKRELATPMEHTIRIRPAGA